MKIRLKGLRSLIKAVQNRAHLFPVKVLVNGKTKTYYSIRYKTGNKAMEIARKQMRIPNNAEILFDSIDGKKKNLTEKDVLKIYDKAGKPGSLQEFIKANFKKPIVKPKNSTIVSLKNQQLSIDDLMQDKQNRSKEPETSKDSESGITITGPIYDDDERPTYYINDNGNVIETQDPNLVEQYRKKQKEANNQGSTDDKDNNQNDDNESKENPGKENKKPQNEITDPKQKIIDKLQQKGAFIWKKGDYERLYFNEVGKDVADRIAKEEGISKESSTYKSLDYFTNKMYLDLKDGKLYIPSNGSKDYKLDSQYYKKIIQYAKEIPSNIDTTSNENVKLLSAEGEEKLLSAIDGKLSYGNPYRAFFDPDKMLKLAEIEDKDPFDGKTMRKLRTLESTNINLITGEVTTRVGDPENIIPKVQETINKLISEIKAETQGDESAESKAPKKEKELSPEDIVKLTYRLGTKKIESKNEYQKQNSVDSLVDSIRPLKDKHIDIKGRAIMDMIGIDLPLYSKRNARTFGLRGIGAVGVCRYLLDFDGSRKNKEICLVADRGNPAAETKTAIHECMHAKISDTVNADLRNLGFGVGRRRKSLSMLEETLVETAGQALGNLIHGKETDKELYSYVNQVASYLPIIWGAEDFDKVRKNGIHGLGKEIAEQLMANNSNFLTNILDEFDTYKKDPIVASRYRALETKIQERTDKVQKIQEDTGISGIGDLVEELKRGTISLEGALNSSKYRELAAVLITKFLEDEDLDVLEGMALSF